MSTMYGTYTNYGYAVHLRHGERVEEIYRAGNCKADSSQTLPPGAPGTLGPLEIALYCEYTGTELANERGVQWMGCRFDEDEDKELKEIYRGQHA